MRRTSSLLLMVVLASARAQAQSCGEAGGDYCSQSGSCPAGYSSLGNTYDCAPCCRQIQQGPSCGAIGGNYCSQSASCPSGYRSLGGTYDCATCCQQLSGQSMTGRVYTYTDRGSDFAAIWARGVTESDYNTYGHRYRVSTTLTSPTGRSSTQSGGSSTVHSEALATLPYVPSDVGTYTATSWHFEFCPYVNQEWPLPVTRSTFALKMSSTCWKWQGQFHPATPPFTNIHCQYGLLKQPCSVSCKPGPYGEVEYSLPPGASQQACPEWVMNSRYFFQLGPVDVCAPKGTWVVTPMPAEACVCQEM